MIHQSLFNSGTSFANLQLFYICLHLGGPDEVDVRRVYCGQAEIPITGKVSEYRNSKL